MGYQDPAVPDLGQQGFGVLHCVTWICCLGFALALGSLCCALFRRMNTLYIGRTHLDANAASDEEAMVFSTNGFVQAEDHRWRHQVLAVTQALCVDLA